MAEHAIVTGAAGFIGSHLTEALLDAGVRVTGIDAFTSNYDVAIKRDNARALASHAGFTLVEAQLQDLDLVETVRDADYVFHLAAQPGVRQSWDEHFDDYVDANIRVTQRLCDALRTHPPQKLVYASSSSVYGESATLPMSESHPTRPYSPYGVTKLTGELLCRLYGQNFGLPVVALRFFTVYGPRQRGDMAFHRFISRALDGHPLEIYGNGEQTRDFTFVSDVVDALLAAMRYEGGEDVFNVGGGTRVTLNHALDVLLEVLPDNVDVRYGDTVKGDVSHTYADTSLAQRELGYMPSVALEEGLAREVEWLRKIKFHGKAGDRK